MLRNKVGGEARCIRLRGLRLSTIEKKEEKVSRKVRA